MKVPEGGRNKDSYSPPASPMDYQVFYLDFGTWVLAHGLPYSVPFIVHLHIEWVDKLGRGIAPGEFAAHLFNENSQVYSLNDTISGLRKHYR